MAQAKTIKKGKRIDFGSSKIGIDYPDFLEIQLKSFEEFFQIDTLPEHRETEGLFKVFNENFPITDTRNQFVLEFLDYFIDPPRYAIDECIERGLTYSVPLKAKLKLYCTDPEHEDFETIVQDVYLGQIPYMTPRGSFVVNGAERVVVSQLHRSPGVFFGQSRHANGTKLYSARVIPFKGSWIEFATDINGVMYAYIDRKKKLPVTTLLRAIGFESDKQILEIFGLADEIKVTKAAIKESVGRKLAARVLKTWVEDFVDEDTGEVVSIERNEVMIDRETVIEEHHVDQIVESGAKTVILHKAGINAADYALIYNTLQKDTSNSEKEAVEVIYRQLRNAEPPDLETARGVIDKLFFSEQRYDLGEVGRYRINKKLGLQSELSVRVLTKEDIIFIIKYLIELVNSKADVDDIDHLSNRRVRTVGEQLHAQFGVGLARMARTIRERMNVRDNEVFTPTDLINAKTLSSVINSFFGTNQLSQFMDQTNPLSEITHKRRMSALGPGGLSRERAGFEVRDVHYTHYGRLCTIETPEGPNIGLISSLCVYSKINNLGFIETPYRQVNAGKVDVSAPVVYLSAEEEDNKMIAQANAKVSEKGEFETSRVKARLMGDFPVVEPKELHLMDVGPNQIASIAASLIPFLEHNDANRALMGSNMMRQAVPLLRPEAPTVGTGLEELVARDSRVLITAEGEGTVKYVDSDKIIVDYRRSEDERIVSFDGDEKEYSLTKFRKTNQSTCMNLRPTVRKGEKVSLGQPLCEGYGTQDGELAIGRNLQVAFMPWKGYNFEDAIVISERVASEDIFTSIHIDEYNMEVRDTKRGLEELTSDIPNVSEEATKDLDENGLIRIGAEIKEGDILIGKITPKGETDPSPEEKLLRAIFGDKAGDVKDASMKAPPGAKGIVIDKKLFSRAVKDKKAKGNEKGILEQLDKDQDKELGNLKNGLVEKLMQLVGGESTNGVFNKYKEEQIKKGTKYSPKVLQSIDFITVDPTNWVADKKKSELVRQLIHNYTIRYSDISGAFKRKKFTVSIGDELPAGIVKLAKVYVAAKRKLTVGDKMAGRHGNKGIVADRPRRRHAVPGGWHSGGHRAEPAGRAQPHEPGPDLRDRAGLGRQAPGPEVRHADLRWRHHRADRCGVRRGRRTAQRQDLPHRRRHRPSLRPARHGWRDLHDQARPHGR
jgi:DNA-directed RNA polymerase subunit beta